MTRPRDRVRTLVRPLLTLAVVSAMVTLLTPAGERANASTSRIGCVSSNTPVALAPGQPRQYTIYGELCGPRDGDMGVVQLLLPGGTYNHYYWDFPEDPGTYSYVDAMNAQGYTTFNIDRIGTGKSSHPLGALVDVESNGYVVHQLVQGLRAAAIAGQAKAADKVVLVAHSLGTIVATREMATYNDADGLIATGIQHKLNLAGLPKFYSVLYPAMLDSRFRDRDPSYFTSMSGTRGSSLFYNPTNTDPDVPTADAAYARDTVTVGEYKFPLDLIAAYSRQVTGPVLNVSGQVDNIFCGPLGSDCSSAKALHAQEKSYFPKADLETYVLANAGHCINLQKNAQDWYRVAESWMHKHFPLS